MANSASNGTQPFDNQLDAITEEYLELRLQALVAEVNGICRILGKEPRWKTRNEMRLLKGMKGVKGDRVIN